MDEDRSSARYIGSPGIRLLRELTELDAQIMEVVTSIMQVAVRKIDENDIFSSFLSTFFNVDKNLSTFGILLPVYTEVFKFLKTLLQLQDEKEAKFWESQTHTISADSENEAVLHHWV